MSRTMVLRVSTGSVHFWWRAASMAWWMREVGAVGGGFVVVLVPRAWLGGGSVGVFAGRLRCRMRQALKEDISCKIRFWGLGFGGLLNRRSSRDAARGC